MNKLTDTENIRRFNANLYVNQNDKIASLICETLFKNTNIYILESNNDEINIDSNDTQYVVLNLSNDTNCTNLLKSASNQKLNVILLKNSDINEEEFDDFFNVNFLLYNLELIRVLSVRSKVNFIRNFTLDNIRKNFTDSKIDISSLEKHHSFFFSLYRILAFEKSFLFSNLITKICDSTDHEKNIILDTTFKILDYSNGYIKFANQLILYFNNNLNLEKNHDLSVFNLLNHALNILKDNDLNKINQHMTPIMLCSAAHDSEGKYSNIVSNHINRIPTSSQKSCILTITFFARLFGNEKYYVKFSKLCSSELTKNEQIYYDILKKVESAMDQNLITKDFTKNELKQGIVDFVYSRLSQDINSNGNEVYNILSSIKI